MHCNILVLGISEASKFNITNIYEDWEEEDRINMNLLVLLALN